MTLIVKMTELNQSSGIYSAFSRIVRFMLNLTAIIVLSGCTLISSQYVSSSPLGARPAKDPSEILVYYTPQDVQFEYVEIGRVFLKNINYWADRDPGAQTEKIISEAADHGVNINRLALSSGVLRGITNPVGLLRDIRCLKLKL